MATPLSQSIAKQIEQLICDAELTAGQKIPSERALSTRMRVSRAVVREALRELHGRGLIETRQGKGSFVADMLTQSTPQSPFMNLYFEHERTLFDLYEVRGQLEGQAANLAATRASPRDMYRIEKAYAAMAKSSARNRAQRDQAFHQCIVDASHNSVLIHLLASIKQLILHSVEASVSNLSHREDDKAQIDKHHRQIYSALINRNAAQAERAAKAHVRYVSEKLQQLEQRGQQLVRNAISQN
ncbi:MAG: FCD domain-containing protein [Pseudomonadales bacterium]